MSFFTFEKLEVWQKSRVLVASIYTLIDNFPSHERFGLSSQLSRAVVSGPSNIAKGLWQILAKGEIPFF